MQETNRDEKKKKNEKNMICKERSNATDRHKSHRNEKPQACLRRYDFWEGDEADLRHVRVIGVLGEERVQVSCLHAKGDHYALRLLHLRAAAFLHDHCEEFSPRPHLATFRHVNAYVRGGSGNCSRKRAGIS